MYEHLNLMAYAKINLGLDVIRRRDDGYHEVKMIMQTIGIYDSINLSRYEGKEIKVNTNLDYLCSDQNNLVYKAAKLLFDEFDIKDGLYIDLKKYIPIAAGMAGGSSDAAAVMHGVNRMYDLGLDMEDLKKRGVKIGADVPYCLMGGTALAEGIGEVITKLPDMPFCYIVAAKPPISVSTKFVYQNLNIDQLKPSDHPDIDIIIGGIKNHDILAIASNLKNILETVTEKKYPVIAEIKARMIDFGALGSIMSGSGPTVFGIFVDKDKAKLCYENMRYGEYKDKVKRVYLTSLQKGWKEFLC